MVKEKPKYNQFSKPKKEIRCGDCGKLFKFIPIGKYPRKYCDKCSKDRKKHWDNRHLIKFEDAEDE